MKEDNIFTDLIKLINSHRNMNISLEEVSVIQEREIIKLYLGDKSTAEISFENLEDYRKSRSKESENVILKRIIDRYKFT